MVFRRTLSVRRRGLKRDLLIRRAGVCAVEEQAPRCVAVHCRTAAEQITPIGWYPLWAPRATLVAISDSR